MPSLSNDTTFNFTLGASDGVNTTTRAFNIVGTTGTEQVDYVYGGLVTTDYSTHGTYGISGGCLLYTSPSPRDATLSRMPSSA